MCGIFAYNGKENSIPKLLNGLQSLEYRGYDSAGIFSVDKDGNFFIEKSVGKVSNLSSKVNKNPLSSNQFENGIAHTRWATHGEVNEKNTHPHYSSNNRFYVVHNGIIENYVGIKNLLEKKYSFYSDTDSEVIAKLIEEYFDGNLHSTIEKVCTKLVGAYAIAVIDKENPEVLVGAKLGSPLIVGEGESGIFLSSDINAIGSVATEFISLDDRETVVIKDGKKQIYSLGEKVEKESEIINNENVEIADKGKFNTFTEKEINDIPEVIKNVFKGRINFKENTITNGTLEELNSYDIERVEIIASGSSYFAGQVGTYWFKEIANIPTEVRISSEFLYDNFIPNKKTLYIFLSQSGETADVRECVKMVKMKGCLTFGVVNVVGSTIARMCDMGLYCHSGVEIGVASTKNIIAQYGVLLLISISIGLKRDFEYADAKILFRKIEELPEKYENILKNSSDIKKIAKKYSKYESMFFLGRNILYPVAAEGSLKLKELSYIHSECYSTGELKHGPLALINKQRPTIAINLKGVFREKTISNLKEIKARHGKILGFISEGDKNINVYDDYIIVPKSHPLMAPFMPLISMWLFSVEIAKLLGRDIDKPQNLAKSVTVE